MKRTVAIVGGGAAGLMLAAHLDENKYEVRIYERNMALGRKFLVAGDGGFNLTHAEDWDHFLKRYSPEVFVRQVISGFTNQDLRTWLSNIGVDTYVGTSQRVFPEKQFKPIEVLNAILKVLDFKKVQISKLYTWSGWEGEGLRFEHRGNIRIVNADLVVFALGGGSWKVTGSQGEWLSYFEDKQIETVAMEPSNCAFGISWPVHLLPHIEGKFLKNIAVACGGVQQKGEVVLSRFGIEGGALYALSGLLRTQLRSSGFATISLDLKNTLTEAQILQKLRSARQQGSWSQHVEKQVNLSKTAMVLLKEFVDKDTFTNADLLAQKIKSLPLHLESLGPIDEAISTVGGIALEEVDAHLQLKKLPGHYCLGEMLDWDAPTGGYLLQACLSMGVGLARHLNTQ